MENLQEEANTGKAQRKDIYHVMKRLIAYAEAQPGNKVVSIGEPANVVKAESLHKVSKAKKAKQADLSIEEQIAKATGFNTRLWQRHTIRRQSKSCNSTSYVFATFGNWKSAIGFNANAGAPTNSHCNSKAMRHLDLDSMELFRLAVIHDISKKIPTGKGVDRFWIEQELEKRICTDCLGKKH